MRRLDLPERRTKGMDTELQRGSFNNPISIQADNVSLKTDNGSHAGSWMLVELEKAAS